MQIFSLLSRIDVVRSHTLPFSPGLILILVIIVPFYEEVFFRGCLFGGICSFYKKGILFPSASADRVLCLENGSLRELNRPPEPVNK
ncbi:CPBP family glutamic-type intramembrane protease [Erwinia sp. E_sp_B01_9]|uniref:CPBP family glutamic-type intramembrane protease n=1 Tax=unclassified Erwinia TaxID=2622719 RepID=UPI003D9BC023